MGAGSRATSSYSPSNSSPFYQEFYNKYGERSATNQKLKERLANVRENRDALLKPPAEAAPAPAATTPATEERKLAGERGAAGNVNASPIPFDELLSKTAQLQNQNQRMRERVQGLREQNQAVRAGIETGLTPADALAGYQDKLEARSQRQRERRQERRSLN